MENSDIKTDEKTLCKSLPKIFDSANNFEYFQSFDG